MTQISDPRPPKGPWEKGDPAPTGWEFYTGPRIEGLCHWEESAQRWVSTGHFLITHIPLSSSHTYIRPKQGEKAMSDKLPTDWTLEQARELIEAKGDEWRKEKAREADAKVGDFVARVSDGGEIEMCGVITGIQSDLETEFCGGHNAGYPESMGNQPRTAYKLPQEIMESIKNYLRSRGVEVK